MSGIFKAIIVIMHIAATVSELPPVKKCKISDGVCMRVGAQGTIPMFSDGIKEIGTEPLDVMKVENIKVDLAGLKMEMKNTEVKGLRKSVVEKVGVDMNKKVLDVVYLTNITMKGLYTAGGRLLFLPINGDGDYSIKLKNLRTYLTIPFELIKGDQGKEVADLKSFKSKIDEDHVHFQFNNLFNGNKLLADAMLKFMNDNWKLITNEFGPVVLQKPMEKLVKAVKTYLHTVPIDNLIET